MEKLIIFVWITSILLAVVFFYKSIVNALRENPSKRTILKRIDEGKEVTLLYVLYDNAGTILDSKHIETHFKYVHGEGQILAGLEKRLKGLMPGDKRKLKVQAKEAYGNIDPAQIIEVPKGKVPEEAIKVGAMVKEIGEGKKPGKILEIKDETILIDYNHPLAGKHLLFDIEVIDVQDVKTESARENPESVHEKPIDQKESTPVEDEQKKETVPEKKQRGIQVSDGMIVTFDYVLTDVKGDTLETTQGKGPITFVYGSGKNSEIIIPALEKRMVGLTAGTSTDIVVPAEEAYGETNPDDFQEVDKDDIFTDELKVGSVLENIGPDKKTARIHEIKETMVILDFNNPLAGQTLSYHVTIINVKKNVGKGIIDETAKESKEAAVEPEQEPEETEDIPETTENVTAKEDDTAKASEGAPIETEELIETTIEKHEDVEETDDELKVVDAVPGGTDELTETDADILQENQAGAYDTDAMPDELEDTPKDTDEESKNKETHETKVAPENEAEIPKAFDKTEIREALWESLIEDENVTKEAEDIAEDIIEEIPDLSEKIEDMPIKSAESTETIDDSAKEVEEWADDSGKEPKETEDIQITTEDVAKEVIDAVPEDIEDMSKDSDKESKSEDIQEDEVQGTLDKTEREETPTITIDEKAVTGETEDEIEENPFSENKIENTPKETGELTETTDDSAKGLEETAVEHKQEPEVTDDIQNTAEDVEKEVIDAVPEKIEDTVIDPENAPLEEIEDITEEIGSEPKEVENITEQLKVSTEKPEEIQEMADASPATAKVTSVTAHDNQEIDKDMTLEIDDAIEITKEVDTLNYEDGETTEKAIAVTEKPEDMPNETADITTKYGEVTKEAYETAVKSEVEPKESKTLATKTPAKNRDDFKKKLRLKMKRLEMKLKKQEEQQKMRLKH